MALAAGQTGHLADHQESVYTVVHGGTAGTARPTLGSSSTAPTVVLWVGTVEPSNAVNNDLWMDTTSSSPLTKVKVSGSFVTAGSGTYEPAQLIEQISVASDGGAIDFTSIPATFGALELVVRGRMATTLGGATIRFNGDTAANYDYEDALAFGSTMAVSESLGNTFITIGAAQTAAGVTFARVMIPFYADTAFEKTVLADVAEKRGTSANEVRRHSISGFWRSTAAINRIQVIANVSGGWAAGTTATLYGRTSP